MVTTQCQMDEDTFEALRKYADKQKKPISIVAGEIKEYPDPAAETYRTDIGD